MDSDPNVLLWPAVEIVSVDSAFTQNPLPWTGRIEGCANCFNRLVAVEVVGPVRFEHIVSFSGL